MIRLPKTERSFEEGCLSDTVHVGHPEAAQNSSNLSSAFNQIPLDEACQEYTAFTVLGRGLFQFVSIPFGLSNAPATFQRLIYRVIGPELRLHVFCYLDDIIVVTETFKEHLKWLEAVLDKIT